MQITSPTAGPAERATLGVPAGSPDIVVDGVRLAFTRAGAGPPVICLHATGHGGGDYADFAARFRDRFEIIRIDWPGQGRSGDDSEPASAARFAELLAGLVAALGIDAPILIGNSIGGAAAIRYAAANPVRGLVLCNPGGLLAVDGAVRLICGGFAAVFRRGAAGAWWFDGAFSAYYRLVLPAPAAANRRRAIAAAGRASAPALAQAWDSFGRPEADIRGLAAGLTSPVWVAWCRSDRVLSLARCRPAIAAMKSARLSVFAGGHAAFLEEPDRFAEGFATFAASLS